MNKHDERIYFYGSSMEDNYLGRPVVRDLAGDGAVLCLDQKADCDTALFAQGFKWLTRWEVIVPLRPYKELAADLISRKNADHAVGILGDLRIPVYDPRMMFLQLNNRTRGMWSLFMEHRKQYDSRVAIVLAVWETFPYIKPLPAGTWIRGPWTETRW